MFLKFIKTISWNLNLGGKNSVLIIVRDYVIKQKIYGRISAPSWWNKKIPYPNFLGCRKVPNSGEAHITKDSVLVRREKVGFNELTTTGFPETFSTFELAKDSSKYMIEYKMKQFQEQIYHEKWSAFYEKFPESKSNVDIFLSIEDVMNFNWWDFSKLKTFRNRRKKMDIKHGSEVLIKGILFFFLSKISDFWLFNVHTKKVLNKKLTIENRYLPKKIASDRQLKIQHVAVFIRALKRFENCKEMEIARTYIFRTNKFSALLIRIFESQVIENKSVSADVVLQKFLLYLIDENYIEYKYYLFMSFRPELECFLNKKIDEDNKQENIKLFREFAINYLYWRCINFIYSADFLALSTDKFYKILDDRSNELYYPRQLNAEKGASMFLDFFDNYEKEKKWSSLIGRETWENSNIRHNFLTESVFTDLDRYFKRLTEEEKKAEEFRNRFDSRIYQNGRNLPNKFWAYYRGKTKLFSNSYYGSLQPHMVRHKFLYENKNEHLINSILKLEKEYGISVWSFFAWFNNYDTSEDFVIKAHLHRLATDLETTTKKNSIYSVLKNELYEIKTTSRRLLHKFLPHWQNTWWDGKINEYKSTPLNTIFLGDEHTLDDKTVNKEEYYVQDPDFDYSVTKNVVFEKQKFAYDGDQLIAIENIHDYIFNKPKTEILKKKISKIVNNLNNTNLNVSNYEEKTLQKENDKELKTPKLIKQPKKKNMAFSNSFVKKNPRNLTRFKQRRIEKAEKAFIEQQKKYTKNRIDLYKNIDLPHDLYLTKLENELKDKNRFSNLLSNKEHQEKIILSEYYKNNNEIINSDWLSFKKEETFQEVMLNKFEIYDKKNIELLGKHLLNHLNNSNTFLTPYNYEIIAEELSKIPPEPVFESEVRFLDRITKEHEDMVEYLMNRFDEYTKRLEKRYENNTSPSILKFLETRRTLDKFKHTKFIKALYRKVKIDKMREFYIKKNYWDNWFNYKMNVNDIIFKGFREKPF